LDNEDVTAFNIKDQLDLEDKIWAENHVLNKIADFRLERKGPVQEQIVSTTTRLLIQNLLDRSPEDQLSALNKLGFHAKFSDGQLVAKKPEDAQYRVIDPNEMEWMDIGDIGVDIAQSLFEGIAATVGFATSGPLGMAAAQGGTAALFDIAKQSLANFIEINDEGETLKDGYNVGQTLQEGATSSFLGSLGTIGKGAAKTGTRILGKGTKLLYGTKAAENYSKVVQSVKTINAFLKSKTRETASFKPTRSMLFEGRDIRKMEEALAQISTAGSSAFRAQIEDNHAALQAVVKGLTKDIDKTTNVATGGKVKDQILKKVSDDISFASAAYDVLDEVGQDIPTDATPLLITIYHVLSREILDSPTESVLNRLINQVPKVKSFTQLRQLEKFLNKEIVAQTQGRKSAFDFDTFVDLKEKFQEISSKSIDDFTKMAKAEGIDMPDLVELNQLANKQYKKAINNFESAILKEGQLKKSGVGLEKTAELALDKIPDEQVINKLLRNNSYKEINEISKKYPDAFRELKDGYLYDVLEMSKEQGGRINYTTFVKELNKLQVETQKLFLGENYKAFEALEVLNDIKLQPFNPSRTEELRRTLNNFKGSFIELGLALRSPLPVGMDVFEPMGRFKSILGAFIRNQGMDINELPTNDKEFAEFRKKLFNENLKKQFLRQK
jgi:hypothetical protein